MVNGIDAGNAVFPSPIASQTTTSSSPANAAGKFLSELVNNVNQLQLQTDKAVQGLTTGDSGGLHEVMIALEKSSISMQYLLQVRNKAMDAYQEIMRMQV